MSPSLPAEFCLKIASKVSDSRALSALSLTSRNFHRVTQPLLCEHIVIDAFPTFRPVNQLHATLTRTNPSLAGFVKSFTIDLTTHQLFVLDYPDVMILDEILVRLPRLSAFSILKCDRFLNMTDLTFFTRPRPSVALKTLRLPIISNVDGFSEFLRCQPALERLEFLGTPNGLPCVGRGDLPCLRVLEAPFNAWPFIQPSVTHLKLFTGFDYMRNPTISSPHPERIKGVKVLHIKGADIYQAMRFTIPFINVESLTWELPAMYDFPVHYLDILSELPKLRYFRLASTGPWLESMSPLPRQISSRSLQCLEFDYGYVAYRWHYPSIDYTPIRVRWTCRDGEEWLHDWHSGVERLTSGE